jgi:hypothetical protein
MKSSRDDDFNYFRCDACRHEWLGITAIDARTRAEELVTSITDPRDEPLGTTDLSTADRAELIDAVEQDLTATAVDAVAAESRLLKLEAQTRGLAEAVIAITEPSVTVAPAVQAVKDQM